MHKVCGVRASNRGLNICSQKLARAPALACFGLYGGLHSLQIDALKSIRIVTGTGFLIEVSSISHPNLWWGMRGAGFNFGIVTSVTY